MTERREVVLDLRHLPPPQPLEIALQELAALPRGTALRLVLVHEPLPLLALLPDRGIAWACRAVAEGEVHVTCWRAGDAVAAGSAAP